MIKVSRLQRKENWYGIIFIAPWIIGFLLFQLIPIVQSLYYGFTNYNLTKPPQWIGLANYSQLIFKDKNFILSLKNTFYITFIGVPAQLIFAFVCALLLNLRIKGQSIFRTIHLMPTIMPAVASSILWMWFFNPRLGPVNTILRLIGIEGPTWLADPAWSKPTLILMLCWMVGTTTIIYLAGLQNVPKELYESAQIEGANALQQLLYVTIPLVSPITLFNLITGLIYSFQMFTEPFMLAGGEAGVSAIGRPQGSMLFYSLYLYQNAFGYTRMGKASAMAWLLFVIVMLVTLITLRLSRETTHYDVR